MPRQMCLTSCVPQNVMTPCRGSLPAAEGMQLGHEVTYIRTVVLHAARCHCRCPRATSVLSHRIIMTSVNVSFSQSITKVV